MLVELFNGPVEGLVPGGGPALAPALDPLFLTLGKVMVDPQLGDLVGGVGPGRDLFPFSSMAYSPRL